MTKYANGDEMKTALENVQLVLKNLSARLESLVRANPNHQANQEAKKLLNDACEKIDNVINHALYNKNNKNTELTSNNPNSMRR
jgi:hypothetical protein